MRRRDPCGLRRTESYSYDHFGWLVRRNENGTVFTFAYDAWGRRTRRAEFRLGGGETTEERRAYDKYGRLVEIASFGALSFFGKNFTYSPQGVVQRSPSLSQPTLLSSCGDRQAKPNMPDDSEDEA